MVKAVEKIHMILFNCGGYGRGKDAIDDAGGASSAGPRNMVNIIMANITERCGNTMLDQAFFRVYTKFKLHFYQEIFRRFQDREASLTTVETFCMESIQALGRPTVNEFAGFMRISPPNAAYKVNSLVKKGYVRKVQSASDRREYHLEVTQKYLDYYNVSRSYIQTVMDRVAARFTPEECGELEEMLRIVDRELMPEVGLPPEREA